MKVKKGLSSQGVSVDSKSLTILLKEASRFSSTWRVDMVAAGVLIRSGENGFEAVSTDSMSFFRAAIESRGNLDPVVVNPKILLKLIQGFNGTVRIEKEDSKIKVTSDVSMKTSFREAADFPLPTNRDGSELSFQADEDFVKRLEYVRRACSNDISRVGLGDVRLEKGALKATDGHRAAKTIGTSYGWKDSILSLPAIVCDSVISVVDKGSFPEIRLSAGATNGFIHGTSESGAIRKFEISFCLKNEVFPDLDQVTPAIFENTFSVNVKDLSVVLSKLSKLAEKVESGLLFEAEGKVLKVSSIGSDPGECVESEIEIDSTEESKPVKFVLNPLYVLDAIKFSGVDVVNVRIADSSCPVVLDSEGIRSIVMPCRL